MGSFNGGCQIISKGAHFADVIIWIRCAIFSIFSSLVFERWSGANDCGTWFPVNITLSRHLQANELQIIGFSKFALKRDTGATYLHVSTSATNSIRCEFKTCAWALCFRQSFNLYKAQPLPSVQLKCWNTSGVKIVNSKWRYYITKITNYPVMAYCTC